MREMVQVNLYRLIVFIIFVYVMPIIKNVGKKKESAVEKRKAALERIFMKKTKPAFVDGESSAQTEEKRRNSAPAEVQRQKSEKGFYDDFQPGNNILIVGDGNLSFASHVAETIREKSPPADNINLFATTYHSYEELFELYPQTIDLTVKTIESKQFIVMHSVDATNLHQYDFKEVLNKKIPHANEKENIKFDYVYWNFPHAGCVKGFRDGHPFVNWRHVNLMRKFFRSVRSVLKPNGILTIATNAGASGVSAEDMIEKSKIEEFQLLDTKSFNDWGLSQYERAFGDYRDATKFRRTRTATLSEAYGQSIRDDLVFVFRFDYKTPQEIMPALELVQPPQPSVVMQSTAVCKCGLICPLENKLEFEGIHFNNCGMHQALEGLDKHEVVENFLLSFSAFTD